MIKINKIYKSKIMKNFFLNLIKLVFLVSVFCQNSLGSDEYRNAVIFDCDGVLVNTEELKFKAWKKALRKYNIYLTLDEYIPLIGNSSNRILSKIIENKNLDHKVYKNIILEKNKIYITFQSKGVSIFPEAVSTLKKLINNRKKFKTKIAIVSSAPRKEILKNLKHIGVKPQLLDLIASGEDDLKYIKDKEKNKPKPYIYLLAAKKLKVKPEKCIVFEDTEAGVNSAFLAGMKVFAVPNELTKHQNFSNAISIISFNLSERS